MTIRVSSVYGSPKGLFQDCDLFLGDERRSHYLLVDGSPKSLGGGLAPRRDLFAVVSSAWPAMLDATSPGEGLRRLHGELDRHNRSTSGSGALIASAVVCRISPGGAVQVAEAGDTKALLLEGDRARPVCAGGMPDSDPHVAPLGHAADVREAAFDLGSRRLVLLTDGAYRVLRDLGHADADGLTAVDPLALLRRALDRGDHLDDDATLVLLEPVEEAS